MYVSSYRYLEPVPFIWRTTTPVRTGMCYQVAEGVYSWRTGRRTAGVDVPFGVRLPDSSGSLSHRLRERRRYYLEVDAASSSQAASFDGRYLASDAGHDFASAKFRSVPGTLRTYNRTSALLPWLPGDELPLMAESKALAPSWGRDFGFAKSNVGNYISHFTTSTLASVQKTSQDVFASMAPQAPGARIGETVVELLTGNVPRIVSNIHQAVLKQKALDKALGSDYLATQFGWLPIISDIREAVNVLTAVDRLVYVESTRRSREWQSWSESYHATRAVKGPLSAYGPGFAGTASTNASGDVTVNSYIDHRISSRFTAIARPSIGANMFVEKAIDTVEQLGLWYPSLGWDLLPYSWLTDWAVSLGSGIENATYYGSEPGMYKIDYSYCTTVARSNTMISDIRPAAPTQFFKTEVYGTPMASSIWKERRRASPFGFGVDLTGLSAHQYSILVALGLAKR